MRRTRRSFTPEFKADAVSLARQQGYPVAQACQALEIGETALRRWVMQYEAELAGQTPPGKAIPRTSNRSRRWKLR